MAKKLLLVFLIAASAIYSYAQTCTPNPAYASQPPGIWPDSTSNLPLAGTLSAYNTVIDFKNIVDTTANGFQIKIHAAKVFSFNGLPPGFNYYPSYGSSPDGWINPGTAPNLTSGTGCLSIEAPQTAVQNAHTSPNADGIYPLLIKVDMKISTFFLGQWSQPTWMSSSASFESMMPEIDWYKIKIVQGTSVVENSKKAKFEISQNYPNPFSDETTFNFNSIQPEKVIVRVYNLLGKEVFSETITANAGSNTYKFKANNLPSGIYICSFNNGRDTITKKVTVEKR